ncbi:hypothetical protein [Flavobacterium sp. '19STA2R22 D10 B1']|uniref:hypothetical protein n=1 Tax=Flavobacterium aerium TaxID=3037261 RepID=UPI00278BDA96|nr:hypothetical protein [Flavobacterium sp. '19STA2R22 D10 B1']
MNLSTKKALFILFISFFLVCCKKEKKEIKIVKDKNYELKISLDQKAVLILFPCYPCDIENTKKEAFFLQDLEKEGITTLLLNYNQKLYLSEGDKIEYSKAINSILDQNEVKKENIYIGGFSSGGNVSVLLTNYLLKTKNAIRPKGTFAVDSPLDLEELYKGAKNDIKKNVDKDAVEEGVFLVEMLEKEIGKPETDIEKYKAVSPYIFSCNSTANIEFLKNIKVRFYCEPDLEWQMKNKNRTYEDLNVHKQEKTYHSLVNLGSTKAELIKTENRGIRANGEKHPHSWNIVERASLLQWINE